MSTEQEIEIAKSCPIYDELQASFHLKSPHCGNACKLKKEDDEITIVSVCPKTQEECSALSDLQAEVDASRTVITDDELEQEKLINAWLKEKGLTPSSLL